MGPTLQSLGECLDELPPYYPLHPRIISTGSSITLSQTVMTLLIRPNAVFEIDDPQKKSTLKNKREQKVLEANASNVEQ
jgi:hypothetical protein